MTIRDAVLAYPGLSDMEDYLEKVVLPDRGLSGDEDISSVNSSVKKLLAADLYAVAGGNPDFTENKLTISYPRSWTRRWQRGFMPKAENRKKLNRLDSRCRWEGQEKDGEALFTYGCHNRFLRFPREGRMGGGEGLRVHC